jgi:hypothetical protein
MSDIDFRNLSQTQIAQLVEVDRTTVRAWTKQGMPFKKPASKGATGSYCFSVCVHWLAGHLFNQRSALKDLKFSPLEKVAVGWLAGSGLTSLKKEDEEAYLSMMAAADTGREQALRHLEFARGVWHRHQ